MPCTLIYIWAGFFIITESLVIGIAIWDWINDRKYVPSIVQIFRSVEIKIDSDFEDFLTILFPIEVLITALFFLIIALLSMIWFITIPVTVLTGIAYYARYYIRQKKSSEKETG